VEVVAAADRAELAGGEEAGDGHLAEGPPDGADVYVGLAEERLPTAVAREEEGSGDRASVGAALGLEELPEVLARGLGVAHLELDRLPHLDAVADRERTGSLVHADDVPDEEVAAAQLGLQLADRLPHVEAAPHEELVAVAREAVEVLDAAERGDAAELVDDVPLGTRDRVRLAHRPAALRNDRARTGAREDGTDGAILEHAAPVVEAGAAGLERARGHPADDRHAGVFGIEVLEEAVRGEGVRVGKQQDHRPLGARGQLCHPIDEAVLAVALEGEPERLDHGAGERGGPDRDRRRVLHLPPAADDPAGRAAKERGALGRGGHQVDDGARLVLELRSDEEEDEVRPRAAERGERGDERRPRRRDPVRDGGNPGTDADRHREKRTVRDGPLVARYG